MSDRQAGRWTDRRKKVAYIGGCQTIIINSNSSNKIKCQIKYLVTQYIPTKTIRKDTITGSKQKKGSVVFL